MKKSGFRCVLFTLLALVGIFGLSRVYFRLTDDFRVANITHEMPYQASWDVPSLSNEEQKQLEEILKQKFTYIGKGAQAYAFSSADGKYVIKFFKFKHLKPSILVDLIPPVGPLQKIKEAKIQRKTRLLHSVFDGYRLAYEVHKNETGLIFLQLNREDTNVQRNVQLIDKLGMERDVDLNTVPFMIQRKVQTTRTVITDAMKKGDVALAKKRIGQIFDLYLSEYKKGIYDRDHGVMHNTGFAADQPIHLDVGKLTKDDRMKQITYFKPDLHLIERKFNIWFKANYPKASPEVKAYMDQRMNAL